MTKVKTILAGLVIASMGASTLSFAQPRYESRQEQRQDARRDAREARQDIREARRDLREAREDRREAREARRYYNAREFRRGGRLPADLRQRHYVVNDWRGHRLSAPPRGYQWVQVGSDYVLAAVATGIIANLIFSQ